MAEIVVHFRWINPFFLLPLHRCFFRTICSDNWKFQGNLQILSICFSSSLEKCPILCCFRKVKHIFGTKWNSFKKLILILELSTRFQMLHYISVEVKSESVAVPPRFLAVCVQLCSCMRERRSNFFLSAWECVEMLGETRSLPAEGNTGERRRVEKSNPDCWLLFCTIPIQCALDGRQKAIHWSSQYPSLSTSLFALLLLHQYFHWFPYVSFSLS